MSDRHSDRPSLHRNAYALLEDIARDLSGSDIVFPTFLDVTFRIRSALKSPEISLDELANAIRPEPLISCKVIGLANSVLHNPGGRPITDLKNAIGRIGQEAVRTIAFAVAMDQLLKSKRMEIFADTARRLWEHSTQVAALTRVLARRVSGIDGDEAMFAGLVHDIGVYYLMSRVVACPELLADQLEVHGLLADWHADVGYTLLTALGTPQAVLDAVLTHENDREIDTPGSLADILYLANKIANLTASWRDSQLHPAVDLSILEKKLDSRTLSEIVEAAEEEIRALQSILN